MNDLLNDMKFSRLNQPNATAQPEEERKMHSSSHPPTQNNEPEPLVHDPNDDLVICHLDYQVPMKIFEDVATFLRLLEETRKELSTLKVVDPASYRVLEQHPWFRLDYCRKRTEVRDYAAIILSLACREVLIPHMFIDWVVHEIDESERCPKEELLATRYEFHLYMHDFFLTSQHAIDDLLDPDGVGRKLRLRPLNQQQATNLKQLRSKLEPAFTYYKEFCDNYKSEFKWLLSPDKKSGDMDGCSQDGSL